MSIRPKSLVVVGSALQTQPAATIGTIAPLSADSLTDGFSRNIRYLRISVTDRCNFRCAYCMPEEQGRELQFVAKSQLLSFEEICKVAYEFAELGVKKIRLTGGEPTLRTGLPDLVRGLVAIPGIEQVVMTTNGSRLVELAEPLARAGLHSLHLSLDSLQSERFAKLSGTGELHTVLDGLAAAGEHRLLRGLNAVVIGGENHDEIVALCQFAWDNGAIPRFIEHMPMSDGVFFDSAKLFTARMIREEIVRQFGDVTPVAESSPIAGPARYWRTNRGQQFGIISAMTEHFCDDCNRLRLTATGDLHACLGYDDAVSLRDVLRHGGGSSELRAAIATAVTGKRQGHQFASTGSGGPAKHMISIGG